MSLSVAIAIIVLTIFSWTFSYILSYPLIWTSINSAILNISIIVKTFFHLIKFLVLLCLQYPSNPFTVLRSGYRQRKDIYHSRLVVIQLAVCQYLCRVENLFLHLSYTAKITRQSVQIHIFTSRWAIIHISELAIYLSFIDTHMVMCISDSIAHVCECGVIGSNKKWLHYGKHICGIDF